MRVRVITHKSYVPYSSMSNLTVFIKKEVKQGKISNKKHTRHQHNNTEQMILLTLSWVVYTRRFSVVTQLKCGSLCLFTRGTCLSLHGRLLAS